MVEMKILSTFIVSLCVSFVFCDEDTRDLGTVIGIDLGTTYSW